MAIKGLKNLCTPAYVYLVVSLITVFIMLMQNLGGSNVYCLGMYQCENVSIALIFL